MKTILIVGYGIVGQNLHTIFPEAEIQDPRQYFYKSLEKYDLAFICVQTPLKEDKSECDTSFVEQAILETEAKVICIKSTIPPGTTDKLSCKLKKRLIFSPEYAGETIHANGYEYPFVILGGGRNDTEYVAEFYKYRFKDGRIS